MYSGKIAVPPGGDGIVISIQDDKIVFYLRELFLVQMLIRYTRKDN
jgi:hypothetical protein